MDILERAALVERLGVPGVDLAPLTVLSAPAGYGKTELLRQWKDSLPEDIHLLYLSAAGLDDPTGLWEQVIEYSDAHSDAAASDSPDRIIDVRSRGLQRIAELPAPVVVVIDDFESLTSPELDNRLMRTFMSTEHVYLVVAGHHFASFDTPLLTSQADSQVFRARDLAFTPEEIATLPGYAEVAATSASGNIQGGEHTPVERISKVGGWPVAVAAILRAVNEGSDDLGMASFLTQIDAAGLNADTKKVLSVIDLVGGTSRAVLQEATGIPPAQLQQCLTQLSSRGLVEKRWGGGGDVFVPHKGIEQALTWILGADFEVADAAATKLLHAHDLAEYDAATAFTLLLRSGELREAETLAIRHFTLLTDNPQRTTAPLEAIPTNKLLGFPTLLATLLLLKLVDESVPLEQVDDIASLVVESVHTANGGELAEAEVTHLTYLVAAERILGHWNQAKQVAQQLELRLSEHRYRSYWGTRSELQLMYAVVSLTGILTGDRELAQRTSEQALQVATDEANPTEQIKALERLSLIHALAVEPELAGEHLARANAIKVAIGGDFPGLNTVNGRIAGVVVDLFEGRFNEAEKSLEQLDHLLPRMEQWALFVIVESWVMRATQGSQQSLERLRSRLQKRPNPRLSPVLEARVAATLANLAMHDSNLRAAEAVLDVPLKLTPEVILAKGRLAFLQGNPLEATRIIGPLIETQSADVTAQGAYLLGAAAFFTAGDKRCALSLLSSVDLSAGRSQIQMSLPTIPYEVLHELAVAAKDQGDGRLLALAGGLPARYRPRKTEQLTAGERTIVKAVAETPTLGKTAEALGLSPHTVKSHLRQIYSKLGVSTKAEMIQTTRKLGLL